jgi:hypothetical protein
MSDLNLGKLHVTLMEFTYQEEDFFPRCYTLTHSDRTGDLFLTIGPEYDHAQISGWYTRLMRDEVLASWEREGEGWVLRVHLHVSGGLVLGSAGWRNSIFRQHLRGVLQAFRYGDPLFKIHPELDVAPIHVHFHAKQSDLNKMEVWGEFKDYRTSN